MGVLIGHAVMDENGSIDKAGQSLDGDQTGKEITTRLFYIRTGGWHTYLQPKSLSKGALAAKYMREICVDNDYGYSQGKRWTGYKAIIANGKNIAGAGGSFDCSSLVISCLIFAGYDMKPDGYTGNLVKLIMKTGEFDSYTTKDYTSSDIHALPGGIWVGNGHTAMSLGTGSGVPQDLDKPYIEVVGRTVRVRQYPGTSYKTIYIAKKCEHLKYLESDADTGWYWVETPKGAGCITNKEKYTKLVV